MRPASGFISPIRQRSNVVLPLPLGPIIVTISLRDISKFTSCNITLRCNFLLSDCASIRMLDLGLRDSGRLFVFMQVYVALFFILVQLFFSATAVAAEPLKAVATIKPLHSLVNMVTDELDLPAPELLLTDSSDPHHFSLRPSQAKMLEQANVVFYVSDQIETFLQKQIAETPSKYFKPIAFTEADAKKYSHAWLDMKLSLKMLKAILFIYRSDKLSSAEYSEAVKSKKIFDIPKPIMDNFIERSNSYLKTFKPYKGKTVWFDSIVAIPFVEQFGVKGKVFKDMPKDPKGTNCLVVTHGKNTKMQLAAKSYGHKIIKIDLLGSKYPAGSKQYFQLMDDLVKQISDCLS